jgi:hypothetical protein
MVFNATFNNISVILVEETAENHWPVASHWKTINFMLTLMASDKSKFANIKNMLHWNTSENGKLTVLFFFIIIRVTVSALH